MAFNRLQGKVAVVTGAATGIGKAIAESFVAEGAMVVAVGRRRPPLDELARSVGVLPVAADVAREDDVMRVMEAAQAEFGGIDILVNNAGVTGPVSKAEDIDLQAWDDTIAINIRGVITCIKHAIKPMRARGGGSIINMSSLTGLRGYPMRSAYTSTKFAVIAITESVAHEVGIDNIRVNALCPGAVSGELMERVIANRVKAEGRSREEIVRSAYTDVAALRRWVDPADVAAAAVFLASDESRSITGDRIKVDAGRM